MMTYRTRCRVCGERLDMTTAPEDDMGGVCEACFVSGPVQYPTTLYALRRGRGPVPATPEDAV